MKIYFEIIIVFLCMFFHFGIACPFFFSGRDYSLVAIGVLTTVVWIPTWFIWIKKIIGEIKCLIKKNLEE